MAPVGEVETTRTVGDLQRDDPNLQEVIYLKESHEAPPDLATISHQSEVVKSYVQQWFQLEIKKGRLIRKYDKRTEQSAFGRL